MRKVGFHIDGSNGVGMYSKSLTNSNGYCSKKEYVLPAVMYVPPFTFQYIGTAYSNGSKNLDSAACQEILAPPFLGWNGNNGNEPYSVIVDIVTNKSNWADDKSYGIIGPDNGIVQFYDASGKAVGKIRHNRTVTESPATSSSEAYPRRLIFRSDVFGLLLGYDLNDPSLKTDLLYQGYVPVKKIVVGNNYYRNSKLGTFTYDIYNRIEFTLTGYDLTDNPAWDDYVIKETKPVSPIKTGIMTILNEKFQDIFIPYG